VAAKLKLTEDIANIASMVMITILIVVGLLVLAAVPETRDNVIPIVSLGVTALVSFRRPAALPVTTPGA
jgi:hypothetical protein